MAKGNENNEDKPKKAIFLDERCFIEDAEVFEDWSVKLCHHDTFFNLQVIKSGPSHFLFQRWGQVGQVGKILFKSHGCLFSAQMEFKMKFYEKTHTEWDVARIQLSHLNTCPNSDPNPDPNPDSDLKLDLNVFTY
eukprot:TRINITY_DN4494_c0_g1_i1.p1 TRINITY_DN4494_c0_g1~~TRINITY_DN4494_c0_g1_i1.p1  ORF type:complete len:135 (-),score=20.40 TRINITY_DN4494_c0_g1_i1:33-437(-)